MTSASARDFPKKKRPRGRERPGANLGSIPIPSFSSCDNDSSSPTLERTVGESTLPAATPLADVSQLMRVEGAMQIHLLAQRRQKRSVDGKKLVPLEDFYSLARKLSLMEGQKADANQKELHTADLSKEESLLYDLLCVASHSLYRVVQDKSTGKNDSPWCLEVMAYKGNRMEEIRRLVNHRKASDEGRTSILRAIQSHRASSQQTADATASTPTTEKSAKKLMTEATILPGMTLDERVQARAQARQNRQVARRETEESTAVGVDSEILLRLADGIWSHTRHLLLRQKQLESSKRSIFQSNRILTAKERSCVMTLNDVIKTFSGLVVSSSGKSASLQDAKRKEKASKQKVVEALQELERSVPGWLSIVDPQQDKDRNSRLSKHATVWIKPKEYQSVRVLLAGDGREVPIRRQPPIGTRRASPKTASDTVPTTPQRQEVRAVETPQGVARVSLTPSDAKRREVRLEKAPETSLPANKKARTHLASDLRAVETTPVAGIKRQAESEPPMRATPKKRRGLRINRNLIISDADYNGGEIIEPTGASPRGLKTLFAKLKAGKRI